ncbi:Protein F37C4.5 [Aphelenchoides besseyi]|nr:Protein F37C4.5 [Aphelenchoides besseyi]
MSSLTITKKTFEAQDLPFHSVEVFRDRAEVKRLFKVQLDRGLNNVVNVCASVQADSIRVEGKGKAVIHEFQYKTDQVTNSETDTSEIRKLVDGLKESELKKSKVDVLPMIYNKRLSSLDNLMSQLKLPKNDNSNSFFFDIQFEETLNNFYKYHEQNVIDMSTKSREAEVEARTLSKKIQQLQTQLQQLRSTKVVKRSICMMLEALEDQSVAEIELAYQVCNASWTPSYDICVSTTGSKPQLKLIYYGQIVQNCGESWNDANLTLSTAQPRSVTELPTIGTLKAQLKHKDIPRTLQAVGFGGSGGVKANASTQQGSLFSSVTTSNTSYATFGAPNPNNVVEPEVVACSLPEYIAEQHALSTTFTVEHKKTILSDGLEHKVTIATLDLEPVLHYNCVPSKSANVYLTASVINSSSYPLINGKASVYVDNSFSTKVAINTVSQGENFDCSLGVDPTVKVTYKPVHKYQQQVGIFNNTPAIMTEQSIEIKNTKQNEPVVLTIYEHVPKSTNEKIKIKLLSPDLETSDLASSNQIDKESQLKVKEVGARINDAHNLEWTVLLKPMEKRELVVKYAVMYPPTESVQFVESFDEPKSSLFTKQVDERISFNFS